MSGRRAYPRIRLKDTAVGCLRVLKNVTIKALNEREVQVFSWTPVTSNEVMSLYVNESNRDLCLTVSVLDSRPVMQNGAVLHELRLAIHRSEPPLDLSPECMN